MRHDANSPRRGVQQLRSRGAEASFSWQHTSAGRLSGSVNEESGHLLPSVPLRPVPDARSSSAVHDCRGQRVGKQHLG